MYVEPLRGDWSAPVRTTHQGHDVWLIQSSRSDEDWQITNKHYFSAETGSTLYTSLRRETERTKNQKKMGVEQRHVQSESSYLSRQDIGHGIFWLEGKDEQLSGVDGRFKAWERSGTTRYEVVLEPPDMPSFKLSDFLLEHCPAADPNRSTLIDLARRIEQAAEEGDDDEADIFLDALRGKARLMSQPCKRE